MKENLIYKIRNASTANEIELVSEKISQILLTASNVEQANIKLAVSKMHKNLINQANELIKESKIYFSSKT